MIFTKFMKNETFSIFTVNSKIANDFEIIAFEVSSVYYNENPDDSIMSFIEMIYQTVSNLIH
jgi:hypothetical protein